MINLEIDSLDALFDVDVQDFFSLPDEDKEKMDKRDSSKIELETIQALYIPIGEDELNLMERAENENSVIVAQMTPFFEN